MHPRTHHGQTEMVHPHSQCGEEGATAGEERTTGATVPLQPQEPCFKFGSLRNASDHD